MLSNQVKNLYVTLYKNYYKNINQQVKTQPLDLNAKNYFRLFKLTQIDH